MKKIFCIVIFICSIVCMLLLGDNTNIKANSDLLFEGDLAPSSKSAYLVEVSTNTALYAKNENEKMAPASMTKVMSMLLVMEALESGKIKLNDMVVATEEACRLGGSQIYLEVNEKMSVDDLLKSMAIASANDATMALALYIAGTEEGFVKMISPIVPHVAEELWSILGHEGTITYEAWPAYDEAKLVDDEVEIVVQINGKVRAKLMVPADATREKLEEIAMGEDSIKEQIDGKTIRKVIAVPGKLVNIVAN